MAKNRDGLEPGQPVDYDTWRRVELERGAKARAEEPRRKRRVKADEE